MPERTAEAEPRRRRRPRAAVLLAIAALLNAGAGIALGIAVTPDDPSPPPPAPAPPEAIATGDLRVVLPAGWRKLEQTPDVPGVSVDGAAAARGPSADVVLAMLPPESPTLLPPALLAGATAAPTPTTVEIDGRSAFRYAGLGGGRTDVYAVPTSAGVATIACVSESTNSLTHGCDAVTAAADVGRAAPVAADERAAFAIALPAVVSRLNRARAAGRRALARQKSARGRARVSRRLAAAYRGAAGRLTPLAGDAAATTAIVGLLRRLGTDHAALAAASFRRDPAAARRAGARIRTSERGLARRLGEWTGPARGK